MKWPLLVGERRQLHRPKCAWSLLRWMSWRGAKLSTPQDWWKGKWNPPQERWGCSRGRSNELWNNINISRNKFEFYSCTVKGNIRYLLTLSTVSLVLGCIFSLAESSAFAKACKKGKLQQISCFFIDISTSCTVLFLALFIHQFCFML